MDDIDTNELRKLAEAATPGPWGIVGIDDLPEINDLMIVSDAVLGDGEPAWITNIGGPFSQVAGEGMDPSQDERNARFIAAANPTTILALLDRLAAMTAAKEKAERERDDLSSRLECEQYETVALLDRAEKAERERDSSNEQLRVATQMLDSQRDNVADIRTRVADVERKLAEADTAHGQSYIRAIAERNELQDALTRAEATIAKLREAMPSEDALKGAIAAVVIVESVSRKTGNPMVEPARDWLARLDAARKEVG